MARVAPLNIPEHIEKEVADKQIGDLKRYVLELREELYPPNLSTGLVAFDTDLPIWVGEKEQVREYHQKFQKAFKDAHVYYPQASLKQNSVLPASLMLPQFRYDVTKLSVSKNTAKESKNFGSAGALIARCGEFKERDVEAMEKYFVDNPEGRLVCHRAFIDFRARMHTFNIRANKHDKNSFITQFYTTGLVVSAYDPNNIQFIDNRFKKTRPYKNAYKNPIADNGTWKVFAKRSAIK